MAACANQRPITGGPKDEEPPQLLNSMPQDQEVNYKATVFELTFDEYVNAKPLKQELLITPITEVDYEVKARKNVVSIEFDSLLEANTTYTFNFREGIVDITEKNAPENLLLAFSTGPVIDSLELSGRVTQALTGEPAKETSVILYAADDSLTVKGGKAMYMMQTDREGYFQIPNLKQERYQIIALKEKDGDLTYNKAEEKIGFLPQPIQLDSNRNDVEIALMGYDNTPLQLRRARLNKQYVDISFNKEIDSFALAPIDAVNPDNILAIQQKEGVRLFQRERMETDSFQIRVQAQDKVANAVDTVLSIRFEETKRPLEESFKATFSPRSNTKLLSSDSFKLEAVFSKPVEAYNPDSVWLYTKTDTANWEATVYDSLYRAKWVFEDTLPRRPFEIHFRNGSFLSVEGDSLEEKSLSYRPKLAEDYGVLTGTVDLPQTSFILELLNNNGEVEQRIANEAAFTFRWVKPGDKKLRILIDGNNNGVWDEGDFETRTPPEAVYFYPKPIDIKANWDIGLDPITEGSLFNSPEADGRKSGGEEE